jgi:cyclopropane-fatty-acyl-phospholipid synthase
LFLQKQLSHWIIGIREQLTLPLRIELWNGQHIDLSSETPRVTIRLPNVAAARYLLTPSLSNLGAAYVEGAIEVKGKAKDMIAVVNALARTSLKAEGKFSRLVRSISHSKQKDAQAIRYHYDVSNDFYQQFLDPHMVYSCAYFENGDEDLADAQIKKIDHILRKIELQPNQTLLDIGCGWGALVMRAAQQYKARCVGITLSENQCALAKQRVREAGLEHLIDIRLQDYRDVRGEFDRITSVGMFEHVGLRHLPEYFSAIHQLLAPDGVVMNHGITTTDTDNGETPYGGGEFIEKYVFPHGELAHIGNVLKAMQQGALEVSDVENLRRHYARTCAIWTDNFEAHSDKVRELAGDKRYRIWHVYLAGCAYAFEQDWISLYQIVGRKAGQRSATLPWSRKHMYPAAT